MRLLMTRSDTAPNRELIVEIVETLEAAGVASDSYRLYDYIDPDALVQVVRSLEVDYRISFAVESVRIEITEDSVEVDHGQATPV